MPRREDVDPGTVLMSGSEFADWLRWRLEERDPAAVVRFGDGEARLLMVNPGEESERDATRRLGLETGFSFPPEAVLEIKALVSSAFDEADVLGIRYGEEFVDEHKIWMDRLASIYAERVAAGRAPAALAHCLLGHQIADALPELLAGRCVSVVSCRDVKPVLEADWGLEDVAVYQVPSQHTVRDVDGPYEAAMHEVPIWPDALAGIHSTLTVRERGEVFLVGAGLFGKDLCIRIRDLGGIALDMGSALDRIAGKITRGPKRRVLDLQARGMSAEEIAAHLQELYRVDVDREMVLRSMAEIREELAAGRQKEEGAELSETKGEERRLRRRLEALERERIARVALVEVLEAEVARAAESRSFRYGHGLSRRLSRLLLRRPARRSALDSAGELLEEARRDMSHSAFIPD